ncbi:MAG: Mu transposase C-terminal domain-containing protein [Dethiobacter sp.]
MEGNRYEVTLDLAKRRILLRYDPFDLSVIQVWSNGQLCEDAAPMDLTRSYHRRVKPDEPQSPKTDPTPFSRRRVTQA